MPISSFIMLFFDFTTVALHHLELKITLMYLMLDWLLSLSCWNKAV